MVSYLTAATGAVLAFWLGWLGRGLFDSRYKGQPYDDSPDD